MDDDKTIDDKLAEIQEDVWEAMLRGVFLLDVLMAPLEETVLEDWPENSLQWQLIKLQEVLRRAYFGIRDI